MAIEEFASAVALYIGLARSQRAAKTAPRTPPLERWRQVSQTLLLACRLAECNDRPYISSRLAQNGRQPVTFCDAFRILRHLLCLRASAMSAQWRKQPFKHATLRLSKIAAGLAAAGCPFLESDRLAAAEALAACLGTDRQMAWKSPEVLYPSREATLLVARVGRLSCEDIPGGRARVVKYISALLPCHIPHECDIEILNHFQIEVAEVGPAIHGLVVAALERLAAPVGVDPILRSETLLSLLTRQPVSWWALAPEHLQALHASLERLRHQPRLHAQFAAWAGNTPVLGRVDAIDAVEACVPGRKGLEPARVLASLQYWSIMSSDVRGGGETVLKYVLALLQKPRTLFAMAVAIASHFQLADDTRAKLRFEEPALTALATLIKNDARAAQHALQSLALAPAFSRAPADWPAAAYALKKGFPGPVAWPAWQNRAVGVMPWLRLCVPRRFVTTLLDLEASVTILATAGRIGLDAEWGIGTRVASIVQLAFLSEVHIWDLQALDAAAVSSAFAAVLGNADIVKVGFHFLTSDWPRLAFWTQGTTARSIVDLDKLWGRLRPDEKLPGLRGLVSSLLARRLDKAEQCSNWCDRPLSDNQLDYAALDAHCLLALWDALDPSDTDVVMTNVPALPQTSADDMSSQPSIAPCCTVVGDPACALRALDFRVGCILSAAAVVGSDHLICCTVDIGRFGSRQLVQGCPVEPGQRVLVLLNVVPREMHGLMSAGGLLVAYHRDGQRGAASPPSGAGLGTALFGGAGACATIDLSIRGNAWEQARALLSVSEEGTVLANAAPVLLCGKICIVHGIKGECASDTEFR